MKPISAEDYCRRAQDTGISKKGPIIRNEHGFMVWSVMNDIFFIWQMYGDGVYWMQLAETMAKTFGLKKIQSLTKRNPKAWIRKFDGVKLAGYMMEKEL